MPQYLFVLGKNPALSAAEALRVLETQNLSPAVGTIGSDCMVVTTATDIPDTLLARLGGTEKIAAVLTTAESLPDADALLALFAPLPKKWRIAISLLGVTADTKRLLNDIKKAARSQESRLSFVLPKGKREELNAAQVLFNALHRQPNAEIILAAIGSSIVVARTIQVQDISAYEQRDTGKPARDTKSGMLPPKLAQIMLNLATAKQPESREVAVLDPFCGSGTILQEGWLMGLQMVGSDSKKAVVESAAENLAHVHQLFSPKDDLEPELEQHNAAQAFPQQWEGSFSAVVTEPFLGKPLFDPLPSSDYEEYITPLRQLYAAAFSNIHAVLQPGGRVLFLLPAVTIREGGKNRISPFPRDFVDEIEAIGYRMIQLLPQELQEYFPATDPRTLLYGRPDTIIHRELTLWEKV